MSFVRKLPTAARILLGLVFTVFGANFFLKFFTPPPPPAAAGAFLGALFASGYVFPIVKAIEVVAGLLLLGNRFVPLALTLLAPIVVNIVGYHLVLAPEGAPMVLALLGLELYLAWTYRAAFAPMLRTRVSPAVGADEPDAVPAAAAVRAR